MGTDIQGLLGRADETMARAETLTLMAGDSPEATPASLPFA